MRRKTTQNKKNLAAPFFRIDSCSIDIDGVSCQNTKKGGGGVGRWGGRELGVLEKLISRPLCGLSFCFLFLGRCACP